MGFDSSLKGGPPAGVRTFASSSSPLIPQARRGDVVIAPKVFRHDALTAENGALTAGTVIAPRVSVAGQDLEDMIADAETNRLTPNAVTDREIAAGAITSSKMSAPIPVALGGTGVAITPAEEGMVVVGNGSGEVSLSSRLAWSGADDTLRVERAVRIQDFEIVSSGGSLRLTAAGLDVDVDLTDYSLGLPPVLSLSEPTPGLSDSNVVLDYAVTAGGSEPASLHVAWYSKAGDEPRLPEEVVGGIGALDADRIDVGSLGPSGSYTIAGLQPVSDYVVRATVADRRGNLSAVHPLDVRTTDISAPSIQSIHSYATSPSEVGFSVANNPDTAEMLLVCGVLTSKTPAVTEADVDAHAASFFSRTIEANASVDQAVSFATAHDPANSFAAEAVREARTYHPFVFYRDAEGNVTIRYGEDIYNPDVTPPSVDAPPELASAAVDELGVSCAFSDAVGVASARAYVSLMAADGTTPEATPVAAEVLAQGDPVSASGASAVASYHSAGAAQPLLHTARYRVFVAAEDAAGNASEVAHFDASTLDGADPVFDAFSLGDGGGSNVEVAWAASDAGPHAAVSAVHLVSSAADLGAAATPEYVRDNSSLTTAQASGTAVFYNVPAYETSHLYGVAEDSASAFGGAANRLSAVASDAVPVPAVTAPAAFYQVFSASVRAAGAAVDAASGPVTARLVVFKDGEAEAGLAGAALSNAVFSSAAHDELRDIAPGADALGPSFGSFAVAAGALGSASVGLEWSIADAGDAAPDLHVAAHDVRSHPTDDQIVAGTGVGFVSKAVIADAGGTTSYDYGTGAEGPLSPETAYHFYAVAVDESGNKSSVRSLSAITAPDTWIYVYITRKIGGHIIITEIESPTPGVAISASSFDFTVNSSWAFAGGESHEVMFDGNTALNKYGYVFDTGFVEGDLLFRFTVGDRAEPFDLDLWHYSDGFAHEYTFKDSAGGVLAVTGAVGSGSPYKHPVTISRGG